MFTEILMRDPRRCLARRRAAPPRKIFKLRPGGKGGAAGEFAPPVKVTGKYPAGRVGETSSQPHRRVPDVRKESRQWINSRTAAPEGKLLRRESGELFSPCNPDFLSEKTRRGRRWSRRTGVLDHNKLSWTALRLPVAYYRVCNPARLPALRLAGPSQAEAAHSFRE